VNSLPKTITRQLRNCDLNPSPTAPESSTLTTRLPSHSTVVGRFNNTPCYQIPAPTPLSHSELYAFLRRQLLFKHDVAHKTDKNRILDLDITSSDTLLAPAVSFTHWSPSNHFQSSPDCLLTQHHSLLQHFTLSGGYAPSMLALF